MSIVGLTRNTKIAYQREIAHLPQRCGVPPDRLFSEQIKAFVVEPITAGRAPSSTNVTVAARNVFCRDTLKRLIGVHDPPRPAPVP